MPGKNAFYAQSGGVTAVINATACGVIETARKHRAKIANVYAGLEMEITTFDASAGGLGGCPYAPGAAGNLATEDIVYLLDRLGIESGVDLRGVFAASRGIAAALGRELPGKQYRRLLSTE